MNWRLVDWPGNEVAAELEAPMFRAVNPSARDVPLPATIDPVITVRRFCRACDVGGAESTCWVCGAPLTA